MLVCYWLCLLTFILLCCCWLQSCDGGRTSTLEHASARSSRKEGGAGDVWVVDDQQAGEVPATQATEDAPKRIVISLCFSSAKPPLEYLARCNTQDSCPSYLAYSALLPTCRWFLGCLDVGHSCDGGTTTPSLPQLHSSGAGSVRTKRAGGRN